MLIKHTTTYADICQYYYRNSVGLVESTYKVVVHLYCFPPDFLNTHNVECITTLYRVARNALAEPFSLAWGSQKYVGYITSLYIWAGGYCVPVWGFSVPKMVYAGHSAPPYLKSNT